MPFGRARDLAKLKMNGYFMFALPEPGNFVAFVFFVVQVFISA
jgi:hypothetical protein